MIKEALQYIVSLSAPVVQDRNGIQCALYEADGGAWKIDAMRKIKTYLEAALEGMEGYIVIS